MDRARLQLLTTQATALATNLTEIPDSDETAKERCLNLSAEVRGLLRAWNNLSSALDDPQLCLRPAFSKIVDRLLTDNSRIVSDLRTQLGLVRNQQDVYNAAVRGKRWVPGRHKAGHLLVLFLKQRTTVLRLLQVRYAVAVLDVVLGVVFHTKIVGVEHVSQNDAQAALRQQLILLDAENEAKAVVFREERRLGDKSVLSSQWLADVVWPPATVQQPPFETLALQWFEVLAEEIEVERTDHHFDTRRLTQAVLQLRQDLDLQADAYRDQMRSQTEAHQNQLKQQQEQHDEWKASVHSDLRLMEDEQRRTEHDAASKIEELSSRLEVQQMTIKQLEATRAQWRSHYQNQSEKLQHLENDLSTLRKDHAQQQAKLDLLQEKYEKLQQHNRTLRQKLEQSEIEKDALSENFYKIQTKYSDAVRTNKQWQIYHESQKDRTFQLKKLQDEVTAAREEIAELKADLEHAEGSKNELRNSLKTAEYQRDSERYRADKYKERLTSPRKECPNAFETRQPHHRSSSRSRAPSEVSSSNTATSRGSRTSSMTYVDDNTSDKEYYDSRRTSRRSSRTRSSKGGVSDIWGSLNQRQPAMI